MGGKTSTQTSSVQIPASVLARYNAVNTQAQQAASAPFQLYSNSPDAFVAQLNPTQQAGIAQTQQYANAGSPYNSAAAQYTVAGGQAVNPSALDSASISKYLSPYLSTVAGSTEQLLNQANQQQMEGVEGNLINQGAFGGDRTGVIAANVGQQQQLANANILSNLLNTGYGQALATAQQQQGIGLEAAQANRQALQQTGTSLAGLGQLAQQEGLTGAQAELGAGQVGQQTQQAGLTALYNQFLQQQSYPFQVAQFLANIAEGTGALSGSTTTTTQPGGFFSDERLKEDIEPVGKTFDGQNVVSFRYKGDPRKQIGLVAQDVEKKHPEAVGLAGAYKTVDYGKATKDAAERGHFRRGGLADAANDNRHGYAAGGQMYGTYGATEPGLWPSDIAQILEAQAQMYAPYSGGQGMYGQTGSMPRGGSSYVPSATLPVGHLAVAQPAPRQPSGLSQALNAANQIDKVADLGSKVGSGFTNLIKTPGGLANAMSPGTLENEASDPEELGIMKRGGRIGKDDGGSVDPYTDPDKPGLNIPNQAPSAPKLAVAQPPSSNSQSGLGALGQIANIGADLTKILPFLGMKTGGRVGYDDGGGVGDWLENLLFGPVGVAAGNAIRSNPDLDAGLAGAAGGSDMPGLPASALAQAATAPESGGTAVSIPVADQMNQLRTMAHHQMRHAPPSSGLASATAAPSNLGIGGADTLSPTIPTTGALADALGAGNVPNPAAPMGLGAADTLGPGVAPPGRLNARVTPDMLSDTGSGAQGAGGAPGPGAGLSGALGNFGRNVGSEVGGYFGNVLHPERDHGAALMSLLSGIAAMGTAPTVHPGVALAAGLGAGTQAYGQRQQQEANIAQTQAQAGLIGAERTTQGANALRELPPGPPGTIARYGNNPNGETQHLPDGTPYYYELGVNAANYGAAGATQGAAALAPGASLTPSGAAGTVQHGPFAYDAQGQMHMGLSPRTQASLASLGMTPAASPNDLGAPAKNQAVAQIRGINSEAEEQAAEKEIGDVSAARTDQTNNAELGMAIAALPQTGFLAMGPGQSERTALANWVQTFGRFFGIEPGDKLNADIVNQQLVNKISALQAGAIAHQDTIRAAYFADMLKGVLPSGELNPQTALQIWSQMSGATQRRLDLNDMVNTVRNQYGVVPNVRQMLGDDIDYNTEMPQLMELVRPGANGQSAAQMIMNDRAGFEQHMKNPEWRAKFLQRYGDSARYLGVMG